MNKLKDYDAMKGITILLVVFAHATRMYTPKGVLQIDYSKTLEVITNFIYMFHMPSFVMISGAVYYYVKRERGKYNNQKKYIQNKCIRLIMPFFFFNFAVVMPVLFYTGIRQNVLSFVIKEVLLMASGTHLWYSVMIFNVFVIFNFFENKIHNNDRLSWILLIGLNVFSFMIPNAFQAMNTLTYLLYFYVGYSFRQNQDRFPSLITNRIEVSLLLTVLCYAVIFHTPVGNNLIIRKLVQIVAATSGGLMLYTLSSKLASRKFTDNELFQKIIGDSYGIFLFHPMIIYLMSYWMKDYSVSPLVVSLFMFVVAMAFSILFVNIFRKMRVNHLIGEKRRAKEVSVMEV